ncbi:MAG: hypothetical protein CIT03_07450 [Methanobacterium sp.]|nr:MAG: hypothetical protein CIT03_07450 [Methanobacterium sp.]
MSEIVKKARVKHGGSLKGRVVKVSSKKGSFETPTKAPTSTEINGKRNISFDGPFINPVFEISQRYLKKENVQNLHRKNGTFNRKISEINAYTDSLIDRYLVKYFPQIPSGIELDDRDIRILIDLQLESNINLITIPEPSNNCSSTDFHDNFTKYWEYIAEVKPTATAMPYINLKQDHNLFENKLNLLKEYEHALHTIGIKFASIREYRPNLMSLAEFSEHDFWVHCSDGRRVSNWRALSPGGQLHALQRYGIDTVSIEIPMGGGSISDKDYTTARYFNQTSVTIPKIIDSVDSEGNLECNCPICSGQNLGEVAENLKRYASTKKPLRSVVSDFSKVHEVFASTNEFEISKQKIKEDSLKEYFDEKEGLKEHNST